MVPARPPPPICWWACSARKRGESRSTASRSPPRTAPCGNPAWPMCRSRSSSSMPRCARTSRSAWMRPRSMSRGSLEAVRRAGAQEFIDKLPRRYDERLGTRGARLSGGQRQQIGLARALYRATHLPGARRGHQFAGRGRGAGGCAHAAPAARRVYCRRDHASRGYCPGLRRALRVSRRPRGFRSCQPRPTGREHPPERSFLRYGQPGPGSLRRTRSHCSIADASTCSACASSRAATAAGCSRSSRKPSARCRRTGLGAAAPRIDLTLSLSPANARRRREVPRLRMRSGAGFLSGVIDANNFVMVSAEQRRATDLRGPRHAGFSLPCALRAHGVRDLHPGAAGAGTGSLHGAAVASHGRAVLLTGPTGSGKSTRLPELCAFGFDLLSEDSVFLEPRSLRTTGCANFLHLRTDGMKTVRDPGTARRHPSLTGDSPQERRAEIRIRPAPFEHRAWRRARRD